MIEHCIVCNSFDFFIKYKGNITDEDINVLSSKDFMFARKKVLRPAIAECKNCGFAWSFFDYNSLNFELLYKDVQNELYESAIDEKSRSCKYLFDKIFKCLPDFSKLKKVLEIGCFTGVFLKLLKSEGFITYGIEPSEWAFKYAVSNYNLNVINGFLEPSLAILDKIQAADFDIVAAFDVFEHIRNPEILFKTADKMLNINGFLIFSLPNYQSFQRKICGKYFNLFLLEHLWYFTPTTITEFAKKNNYQIEKIYDMISYHSIYSILFRLSQYPLFKAAGVLKVNFLKKIFFKIKRGDMIVVLKKNNL